MDPLPIKNIQWCRRGGTQGGGLSVLNYPSGCLPPGAPNRGGGLGVATPLNFGWGVEHLSTPPDFEKLFIGGGGGGLASLKLIELYSICIFIYIEILKLDFL